MKHTEGPWFSSFESGRYVISCKGEFGPYKALAITGGFYPDHDGNARLIAAAPDLLEALKDLVAEYEPNILTFAFNAPRKVKWTKALAAIAKATGEGA